MQLFGGSLTASRLLPVVLSLLALPFMYALAWELFASHPVALMATTLLSLSPFDVLFAQTARQYSLLTVMVIASQWLLLRAMRQAKERQKTRHGKQYANWHAWGWYGLSLVIGLYVHPFFGLTLLAQIVYVGLEQWKPAKLPILQNGRASQPAKIVTGFGSAIAVALILYSPWIYVILTNSRRALSTTDWAQVFPGGDYLVKLWTLSFTSIFLDLYFEQQLVWTYCLRGIVLIIIGTSLYTVCRQCDRSVWLAILTATLVPFLLLALPDFILGGKRSAVSRYLISCYPSIQLAVAYWFTTKLSTAPGKVNRGARSPSSQQQPSHRLLMPFVKQWGWSGVFALLVVGSLASLTTSALAFTWWNKDLSYSNEQTSHLIRAANAPAIVSDIGDDFTNTGDLISLSYKLDRNTPLLLSQKGSNWVQTETFRRKIQNHTVFIFRPTNQLREALEKQYGALQRPSLWQERLWLLPNPETWKLSKFDNW